MHPTELFSSSKSPVYVCLKRRRLCDKEERRNDHGDRNCARKQTSLHNRRMEVDVLFAANAGTNDHDVE